MNKLIKKGFLLGVILLLAGNAWALPVAGNQVKMWSYNNLDTGEYTEYYEMEMVSSGKFYNTFCVEREEHFYNGSTYIVSSVELYATNGGFADRGATWNSDLDRWEDKVEQESMWLYASYFNGLLGTQSYDLAEKVQNAIWYLEDEFLISEDGRTEAKGYWDNMFKPIYNSSEKTFAGWNIQVVNLLDGNGNKAQSQLVGAPVPEPATMVLFGIGLLGLASFGRKKIEKL